ncbi:MAG: hypothetical protein JOZ42_02465, partial [Acetobacteraceae bacterium]|nr:hypothetical protein [Acetobacteraceae bacterium]
MRRNTIGLVWLVGILLTCVLYATGPDRFLHAGFAFLLHTQFAFQGLIAGFTAGAFEWVRALAIGLFAVFLALGVLALRRGLQARAALVLVTGLFLVLLYPAMGGYYLPASRWSAAFLLACVGALVMTRRLLSA